MRHKHIRYFIITLLVSFAAHLFVLTVLFAVPELDMNGKYKKIKVKFSTSTSPTAKNNPIAEKYTSVATKTTRNGQNSNYANGIQTSPSPSNSGSSALEPPGISNNNLNHEADKPSGKQVGKFTNSPSPNVKRVMENVSNEMMPQKTPLPAMKPNSQENNEDDGVLLGNSQDGDTGKLVSYEQMLPLWLDKFKQHPMSRDGLKIEGEGEVFIKIDRKGKVLLAKVIKTTGSQTLDKALMKMIEDADPVLPVPDNYHADKKTFSYKIAFEFKEPGNEQ